MEDKRPSELGVLTMERGFNVDFEKVIDVFPKTHKNSRNYANVAQLLQNKFKLKAVHLLIYILK